MSHTHSAPGSSPAATLRIWPPSMREDIPQPSNRLKARPEMARARINGLPFRLRHWSALAWERTPVRERPSATFEDDHGGHFALEQVSK